jgi:hypothetical protein
MQEIDCNQQHSGTASIATKEFARTRFTSGHTGCSRRWRRGINGIAAGSQGAVMSRHRSMRAGRDWLFAPAMALLLSVGSPATHAASAATRASQPDAAESGSPAQQDLELGEVLVRGKRIKPSKDAQAIIDWLRRLVGQFRYLGYVELHDASGAPIGRRNVSGVGDCVAFGLAPGVQCTIKVRWPETRGDDGEAIPGGVPTLNPAMVLYGLDPDDLGIHYLQVDRNGLADGGLGHLFGDTLTNEGACVAGPDDCTRTTRITAQPDGQLVQMQTDIVQDGQLRARYLFVQRPMMRYKDPDEP